jgi:DNA repair protein RadA/Sms
MSRKKASKSAQFECNNCGYFQTHWFGKCSNCGLSDTAEERVVFSADNVNIFSGELTKPVFIADVLADDYKRIDSGNTELNRVLGGGFVAGGYCLLTGAPGSGKSSLLLSVADSFDRRGLRVLYVSGEESPAQIKLRAQRFDIHESTIQLWSEINIDFVLEQAKNMKPDLLIVDSVQTVYSKKRETQAGSPTQVQTVAHDLMQFAKTTGTIVVLVGHITKDANIAGPKVLEHLVDTVLYLEGDKYQSYRLLRTNKNRFGANSEIGVLEMRANGIFPVSNPSSFFISGAHNVSGSAIVAILEGQRSILTELQAIVLASPYTNPKRTANGVDNNRLNIILAVLMKRIGLQIGDKDVLVNVVGGIEIQEPAADLALAVAIISSISDRPVSNKTLFVGEIGLAGEIRPVQMIDNRIAEAARMGFERIFIPHGNYDSQKEYSIEVVPVQYLNESLSKLEQM